MSKTSINHLVADISCQFNEIFFHSYVTRASGIFPSAANLTDLTDKSIIEGAELTLPSDPVFCISTCASKGFW